MSPKERPILFTGEMVRAILRGDKTQARQVVKSQPGIYAGVPAHAPAPHWRRRNDFSDVWEMHVGEYSGPGIRGYMTDRRCPYGVPGDRLWARETWAAREADQSFRGAMFVPPGSAMYRATEPHFDGPWKPSIFMPRWASRITLEVTEVRVERVQDISEEDARSEGCRPGNFGSTRDTFADLWDSINGLPKPVKTDGAVTSYVSYPWDGAHVLSPNHRGLPHRVHPNPHVWVVGYRRLV